MNSAVSSSNRLPATNLRRRRLSLIVLFMLGFVTLGVIGKPLIGQNTKSTGPIVIRDCSVKLIDEAVLSSEQSGVIDHLDAQEGDILTQDSRAVQIRDRVIQASLRTADKVANDDTEIKFAAKAAEVAEAKYLGALTTNQKVPGTISVAELRELKLGAEKALLQAVQAQRNLEVAKLKRDETFETLQTYKVTTPFSGIVTKIYKKKGESVRQGDPILEIVNTSRVRVEGYIDANNVNRIQRGTPVQVRLTARGGSVVSQETFQGHIMYVDVKVEPVSNKVRVWAEVENRSNLLRDGSTASMTTAPSRVARQR